jgi:putative DNA methylase
VIASGGYQFAVKVGTPANANAAKDGTKLSRGANFRCVMSDTPIAPDYIYSEANAGRMGARLMAIVAEGDRGRVYWPPTAGHEALAREALPDWKPDVEMPNNPRWFSPPLYGLKSFGDLFTPRQLVALNTFSDLALQWREKMKADAVAAGLADDGTPLNSGGTGAQAYAEAIALYLAFSIDKAAEGSTTLCVWSSLPSKLHVVSTFGRQALQMSWDYAEANVFADSSGNILRMCELTSNVIEKQCSASVPAGSSVQSDAARLQLSAPRVVSTDPPYYDNIGYADLSDFFYVWLRRTLRPVFPGLFTTVAVPKAAELVATPYRHSSKAQAEAFFLDGMTEAMTSDFQ